MAHRVLIASCLATAAACCAMVGVVWSQSTRESARAAEANRRLAELVMQTQATNQEMLKQLQAMAKPAAPAKSLEWIPVAFKLTLEKPDGPPAAGYEVELTRGSGAPLLQRPMRRSADAEGVVDFGVIQPGDWVYAISSGPWEVLGNLNVLPGSPVALSIVCPRPSTARIPTRVRVDWPASLAGKGIKAIARFRHKDASFEAPPRLKWKRSSLGTVRVLCLPDGGQRLLEPELDLHSTNVERTGDELNGDELLAAGRVHCHLSFNPSIPATMPLEIDEGQYSLIELIVVRPIAARMPQAPDKLHDVLGLISRAPEGAAIVTTIGEPWAESAVYRGKPAYGVAKSPSWIETAERFGVRASPSAEWVISLPDELIKAVQEGLKAKPEPTPLARPDSPGGLLLPSPS